jgi:predicted dehydrogenase
VKAPIHVGLIGCGYIGSVQASAINGSGIGLLAAVYDVQRERAQALATRFEATVCESEAELLARKDIQAVFIATPSTLHADGAVRAAEAGKAIFLEKPMCLTSAGCDRILAAVKKHRVSLMVGQVLRFFEPFRSILEWSRAGWLGKPLHVHFWRMESDFLNIADWKRSRASSGGYLYEISCHEMDYLRLLLGEPTQVDAEWHKRADSTHEIEDTVAVTMQFASGAMAQYIGGAGFPRTEYGFCFRFEKATLESDDGFDPQALRVTSTPGNLFIQPALQPGDPYYSEVRLWLEALLEGKPMPVTGEDAAKTIELIEKLYRATAAKLQPSKARRAQP